MKGFSEAHSERLPYDPEAAKALMEEAGYADGFSFGLQCPNDRYINDEAICKAVFVGLVAGYLRCGTSDPFSCYHP